MTVAGDSASWPEAEAVRTWLKENSNDGTWEEVKWWKPVSVTGNSVSASRLKSTSVLRLKFRSKNALGATVLSDTIFCVDGSGGNRVVNGVHRWVESNNLFAENLGAPFVQYVLNFDDLYSGKKRELAIGPDLGEQIHEISKSYKGPARSKPDSK